MEMKMTTASVIQLKNEKRILNRKIGFRREVMR